MSVLELRGGAQAGERLERRAATLLGALLTASPAALNDQLHAAFSWFGRTIAPPSLTADRLARLAARGRFTPARPRTVPEAITRSWNDAAADIVPPGTRALVLVDLVPEDRTREPVTVALSFAGTDPSARLLAVFDAGALVPHLRAISAPRA